MTARDVLGFAWGALSGHRLRSALSLVGVAIGIAAVIFLTALTEGARAYVVGEFANLGTHLVIVVPGRTETTGIPGLGGIPNDLTLDDSQALARQLSAVRRAAPIAIGTETVSRHERSRQVAVIGTTSEYREARGIEMAAGAFLPAGDPARGAPVAVLGRSVAKELFGAASPLGRVVRVGDRRMRVIGVMAPIGTKLGVDFDETVLVPVATAMSMFNRSSLFRVLLEARSGADVATLRDAATRLIAERHGEEDVTVITQDAVLSAFGDILDVLTLALVAIAAISLTVAGIGIMNVMLVSVSERTREIGLLRAVGVARGQVLAAFLAEASLLSLAGGALGVAVGWAAVRVMVGVFPALPATPSAWAVVSALTVAILVGVVFGLLPARRATRLDPARALAGR